MNCLILSNVKVQEVLVQKEIDMVRCHRLVIIATLMCFLLFLFSVSLHADTDDKENPYYDVQITTTVQKKNTLATIKISGKSGYHCNTLYRWKLYLKTIPRVVSKKKTLENRDAKQFTKEAVIFEVPYMNGPKEKISAKLKFSVCSEKQCLIEKIDLSW
jgi:E3 ubiquitin-protein ligase DOA10